MRTDESIKFFPETASLSGQTRSVYSCSSWHDIMVVADITMHKMPHYIHGSRKLTICITGHEAHSEKKILPPQESYVLEPASWASEMD